MRPGAPEFAPASVKANGNMALVRCDTPNGHSADAHHTPPQDPLIVQETCNKLIEGIHKLNARCDILGAENALLRTTLASLPQQMAVSTSDTFSEGKSDNNLCGYASSESTSDAGPDFALKQDVEGLRADFAGKMATVEQILAILNDNLKEEVDSRKKLQTAYDCICADITSLKGRTGALQKSVDGFDGKIEAVEDAVANVERDSKPSNDDSQAVKTLSKQYKKVQDKMVDLQMQLQVQRATAEPHAVQVDAAKTNGTQVNGSGSAANSIMMIRDLRNEVGRIKLVLDTKANQSAKVDECPTRDGLYELYHVLDRDIKADPKDRSGRFNGDDDELWRLRDRVVCRLAIFDIYDKAMENAKAAPVDL